MTAAHTPVSGWIVVDTTRDFALAHYRDHADADAHCDRAEARAGIRCATERRYRTVTAIGADAARYLQQIRMHGLPSQVEADKPSPPWQTLGQPGGRRVGANGERFDFAVRWDMETTAPGMSGYRSAWRRFATAEEAIAAVAAGMARAYRATAFDPASREIATRRNPAHRRNRRAASAGASATDARAQRATRMFSGEIAGMGTRKLDECFEMGDGDRVAAIVLEQLRTDPATARAVLNGQREVLDPNQRFTAHARRYLSPLMIATAEATLANRVTNDIARQHIALRLASPKQADAGQLIARQDNTDGLPLFGGTAQGQLL